MRQRRSTCMAALFALSLAGLSLACAPNLVDENFGKSKRSAQARQIQNPERSEVRDPVSGMGAATAAEVVDNYHRNQKTEAQRSRQESARDSGISAVQD